MGGHLYIALAQLNITANQFETLLQATKSYVLRTSGFPPYIYHKRISNAGDMVIAEGLFNGLTIAGYKQQLATAFGVAVEDITVNETSVTVDTYPSSVWTFGYNSVNRFRASIFAGRQATAEQSRHEARAYILANLAKWENV